jgi:hypothetical protein
LRGSMGLVALGNATGTLRCAPVHVYRFSSRIGGQYDILGVPCGSRIPRIRGVRYASR